MESIGEFFRQVRETKGLTLDDVASKTRIHPDFLIALEEGNYTKLPDQVFAKGFVRSYARSLGLDEEEAMRRFEGSAGAFYDKQAEREQLRLQQIEDERRKKTNRKVVGVAAGVALLGLVLLLTHEQSSVVPPTRSAVESEQTEIQTHRAAVSRGQMGSLLSSSEEGKQGQSKTSSGAAGTAGLPSENVSQPESGEPLSPASATVDSLGEPLQRRAAGEGPLVLDLEALELSWVVVQVDNGNPQEALLRPGERVRWKGSDRFILTLGNAGGVRVELNGKVQGPFGPTGKVARDIILKP